MLKKAITKLKESNNKDILKARAQRGIELLQSK
jgi:hypothetical protein